MAGDPHAWTETELKLLLTPHAERALKAHDIFRSAAKGGRILTTYFDTPDDVLNRRGLSLRVRRSGEKRVQTLKWQAEESPGISRSEWEWPIDREEPDLHLVENTPIADRLPLSLAPDLEPVIVTDVVRTTQTLHLEKGTTVEAAFDHGSIVVGDAREPIRELELDLQSGEIGPLLRLALDLHASVPFTLGVESKATRGYHIRSGIAPQARKAAAPYLERNITADAAIRRIITVELGFLLANLPAARAGDAEGVHQMRVGIRRLRSVLILFSDHLEPHAAGAFQKALKQMGKIFGEARDWDVFCLEALPNAVDRADNIGWTHLLRTAAAEPRAAAHAAFVRAADSPAFVNLALGMAAWAEDGAALLKKDQPLRSLAPDLLDRLQDKVDDRGRGLKKLDEGELHALRKSLKKLRYGVEYLASLYPPKAVKAYLKRCKAVQKRLGAINDIVMAMRRIEELAGRGRTDLGGALAAIAQALREPRRRAREKLKKKWADFKDEPRFWRE